MACDHFASFNLFNVIASAVSAWSHPSLDLATTTVPGPNPAHWRYACESRKADQSLSGPRTRKLDRWQGFPWV